MPNILTPKPQIFQKTQSPNSNRAQTLSVILGQQALLLINTKDLDNPVELAFQSKYGYIRKYTWYADSYLIVGFSSGYVIMVSNDMREISEELFNVKFHSNTLEGLVCSPTLQKAATAGDGCVKFINVGDWKEVRADRIVIQVGYFIFVYLNFNSGYEIAKFAHSKF